MKSTSLDAKTTFTGLIAAILATLAYFGVILPPEATDLIITAAILVIGYLSNKTPE